jgi:hypothetical protein
MEVRRMDELQHSAEDAGGRSPEVEAWEARAVTDLAVILFRYVHENPCPGDSRIALEMGEWAASLELSGQARRAALQVARLRAI